MPMSRDGGIAPAFLAPEAPLPEATPANCVCLRNCRNYMETLASADVYAPTLNRRPVQVMRLCTAVPGVRIELDDDFLVSCTSWDPIGADVLAARNQRRREYLEKNPECEAADRQNTETYSTKAAPDMVEGSFVFDDSVCKTCMIDPCECPA